jgi:small subunit ribosomal protein S16
LKADRFDYWLSVGALPTEKVRVLISKYGTNGTHRDRQRAAIERLRTNLRQAPPPMAVPRPEKSPKDAPRTESEPAAEQAGSADSGEGGSE